MAPATIMIGPLVESLFHQAGVSEEHLVTIQTELAAALRRELDQVTEAAIDRTRRTPGYTEASAESLRPGLRRLVEAYLAALDDPGDLRFSALFRDNAVQRARSGYTLRSLLAITELVEPLLRDVAARAFHGARDLFAAAHVARRLCDNTRRLAMDSYEQVQAESQAERERLMQQFSTPILPVLPGVLVLPVVGPVPEARARQLLDAMLTGVGTHGAHTAILDITGLTGADAAIAGHLHRIAAATRLLGARFVLAGVGPAVATLLVTAGAQLDGVATHTTLADALMAATSRR